MVGMQKTLDMFVIQQHTIIFIPICKVTNAVAVKPRVKKDNSDGQQFVDIHYTKIIKTLYICLRTIK